MRWFTLPDLWDEKREKADMAKDSLADSDTLPQGALSIFSLRRY